MNCVRCGNRLNNGEAFCPECGAQQPVQNSQQGYAQDRPYNMQGQYNQYQQPGYNQGQYNQYQQPGYNQQYNQYQQPGYNQGQYNQYQQPGMPPQQINTWMIPAILATLLCCFPFGIVSIVFASKSQSALSVGDMYGARDNAEKAKIWFIVSVAVGGAFSFFYFIGILSEM
ncbi:MAG: CD225/dispanin family protein [Lentisphaeria bacterium]|nr:CD225/dispanin family protein [Lentisphaeria bacterium]